MKETYLEIMIVCFMTAPLNLPIISSKQIYKQDHVIITVKKKVSICFVPSNESNYYLKNVSRFRIGSLAAKLLINETLPAETKLLSYKIIYTMCYLA